MWEEVRLFLHWQMFYFLPFGMGLLSVCTSVLSDSAETVKMYVLYAGCVTCVRWERRCSSCALQSGTNCSVSHTLLEVKGFWEKKEKTKRNRWICLFVSFNSSLVWFVLTLERCSCLNLVTEQVIRRNCCVLPQCCTTQCGITRITWLEWNEAISESKDNSLLTKQLSQLW